MVVPNDCGFSTIEMMIPNDCPIFFLAWNYENQIKQVSIGIKHMSLWRFSFSHMFDVCFPEYLNFLGI